MSLLKKETAPSASIRRGGSLPLRKKRQLLLSPFKRRHSCFCLLLKKSSFSCLLFEGRDSRFCLPCKETASFFSFKRRQFLLSPFRRQLLFFVLQGDSFLNIYFKRRDSFLCLLLKGDSLLCLLLRGDSFFCFI